MINRLMRMEERIVLDGSAAAVLAAAGDSAEASGADDSDNTGDQLDTAAADNPADSTDDSSDTGDDTSDNDDLSDGTDNPVADASDQLSDFSADDADLLAQVLDSAASGESGLKAIIINTDLADSDDLINAVADDVVLITYSGSTDTLQDIIDQIESVSAGQYYDSIAIAAHSNAGGEIFIVDNDHISAESLESGDSDQAEFFSSIGSLLTSDGRIDLLSCYSGLGTTGAELVDAIEDISGHEVAASTDLTGNASSGGDWILEDGDVDAADLYFDSDLLSSYTATLQNPDQVLTGETANSESLYEYGRAIDYYDSNDDGDGLLAISGYGFHDSDTTPDGFVRLYRESSCGYTLITTIWADGQSDFGSEIALGYFDGDEILVVGDNTGNTPGSANSTFYVYSADGQWVSTTDYQSTAQSSTISYITDVDIIGESVMIACGSDNFINFYQGNTGAGWTIGGTPDYTLTCDSSINNSTGFGTGAVLVDIDDDNVAEQIFVSNTNTLDNTTDGIYYTSMDGWRSGTPITSSDLVFSTYDRFNLYSSIYSIDASIHTDSSTETIVISYNSHTLNMSTSYNLVAAVTVTLDSDHLISGTPSVEYLKDTDNTEIISTVAISSGGYIALGMPAGTASSSGHVSTYWYDPTSNDLKWQQSTQPTSETPSTVDLYRSSSAYSSNTLDLFGQGVVFTSSNELLVSASGEYYSGIYLANSYLYNSDETYWGCCDYADTEYSEYTYADKEVVSYHLNNYSDGFGAFMAEDNGMLVVTGTDITDGILLYTWQSNAWVYTTSFYLSYTCSLGGIEKIYDIDIYGDTLVISIDGTTQDQIYVFNDIDNESRTDGTGESDILSPTDTTNFFGEDIDLEEGVLFITERNTSSTSDIDVYWWDGSEYIKDGSFTYSTNTQLHIAADKRSSGTEAYTLAATGIDDSSVTIWAWEDGVTNMTTNGIELSFYSYYLGATSSNPEVITDVAVAEDYVIVSTPYFSLTEGTDYTLGALVAFHGQNGVWSYDNTINGYATIAAVLTGLPNLGITSIGDNAITISEDGNTVYATALDNEQNSIILSWELGTHITASEYTSVITQDTITYTSDPSAEISTLLSAATGQVLAGSASATKPGISVDETGTVDVFAHPTSSGGDDVTVNQSYTPGEAGSTDDNGSLTFTFSTQIALSEFSSNMEITIIPNSWNQGEYYEHHFEIYLSSAQIAELLQAGNGRSITLDLNSQIFSGLVVGETYRVIIPSGMFTDIIHGVNSETLIYTFTVSQAIAPVPAPTPSPDPVTPIDPQTPDYSGDNSGQGDSAGSGDSSDDSFTDSIADLLDSLLNNDGDSGLGLDFGDDDGLTGEGEGEGDAEGEGEDTGEAEGEDTGDAEGEGDAESEGDAEGDGAEGSADGDSAEAADNQNGNGEGDNGAEGQNGAGAFAGLSQPGNRGSGNSPIIQNPFSSFIPESTLSNLFQSSLNSFALFGSDSPGLSALSQSAMGGSMTTFALASNSNALLSGINNLLASLPSELQPDVMMLSGGGHTAQTISIRSILSSAADDLVQARGNALIANDLLRIISLNIHGFNDKIAENSFSGGIERLAQANEDFAFNYEKLNAILKVIKEHSNQNDPLTAEELSELLPAIEAAAHLKSAGLSEGGDRASKDVLALLTRQMQQKGVNKDMLQEQVSMVFSKWHNSLGLSEPVQVSSSTISDLVYSEQEAVPAL